MKSILDFARAKDKKQKITMLTCYDFTFAQLLNQTEIDAILVGDSLAMVVDGCSNTLGATVDIIARHSQAVVRGAPDKLVIADLPFLSYRKDLTSNMEAVEKIMRSGCQALKLEGLKGNETLISHIVNSGVPIMGHLGLTPQFYHQLGGFRTQGKKTKEAEQILEDALRIEDAGAFSMVLECIPLELAREISQRLSIPTIGIGAGPDTDGQILVISDLLGLNPNFKPKFVRQYLNGAELIRAAVSKYHEDILSRAFPALAESTLMPEPKRVPDSANPQLN